MTLTAATILVYMVALFLTVATLWFFLYANQIIDPKQTDPQFLWVLIVVVIPFLMLVYFGFAILISDTISAGAAWLTADDDELTFLESLVLAVSYVGLSAWLWLRWRKLRRRSAGVPASVTAQVPSGALDQDNRRSV